MFFLLILVLQFLYHDQFRMEMRTTLHNVVLFHQKLHNEYISDTTRFPVMSSEGKLVFDPFPTEPLEFSVWFDTQSRKSNACTLKIKDGAGKTETVSYLSVFLLAWR